VAKDEFQAFMATGIHMMIIEQMEKNGIQYKIVENEFKNTFEKWYYNL
jgi:hypothetical protein